MLHGPCGSGWTGDRCRIRTLHHDGPHTNESQDEIVGWLEQQPGSTSVLQDINRGYPAADMLVVFHEERGVPITQAPAGGRGGAFLEEDDRG